MTKQTTEIIEKLKTRTLAREVVWTNTKRKNEFQLLLPSGRITVDRWNLKDGTPATDFRIYNKDGLEILAEAATEESEAYRLITSLHDAILIRKLNVEETLAGIEKELAAEGPIGGDQDEIPF